MSAQSTQPSTRQIIPMFYEIYDSRTNQLKGCLLGAYHDLKSIGSSYDEAENLFGKDSRVRKCFDRANVVAAEYSSPELLAKVGEAVSEEKMQELFQNEVKAVKDHHAVDSRFEWMAYDREKHIEGLETIEEHFEERQKVTTGWRNLWPFSKANAKCRKETVATAYLQGSEEQWQFMNENCISRETREVHKQRNQRMATKIDTILKDPSTEVGFFVPGSAHLPGPDGMCALLRSQGWTVERQM